jgi:sterol 3beta-glucosyltransferase
MRVVIMTAGSRGDVQPYIALGLGLQRAGYRVCMLTHDIFAPMVEQYGLKFTLLTGNPRAILESSEGQRIFDTGENALRFIREMREAAKGQQRAFLKDALSTLVGADLLLYSSLCFVGSYAAEALHVPAIFAPLLPAIPTRAFPYPIGRYRDLGGVGNRLSHILGNLLIWQMMRPVMQPIRRELGLKPVPMDGSISWLFKTHQGIMLGYSPLVLPPPADWPAWVHVTGYWFLDAPPAWRPPAALLNFLEAGPPPVYIGFGSMANRQAEKTIGIALKALERAKQRGIIATGWSGLSNAALTGSVFKIEEVPHDWLFPRVAAVVHHAGCGTTGAGLRAGVPAVPVPFIADQPFWAERVYRLGVATRPIPRRQLTAENLAAAITTAVTDPSLRARAADLGARIRTEDGVGNAVQIVRQTLASPSDS